MAKEGFPFVLGALAAALLLLGGFVFSGLAALAVLGGIALVFMAFCLWFFRDPERAVPEGEGIVVSPADGKVVEIVEEDNEFMGGPARRISIFLNVFNVHVNRIPYEGQVEYVKYYPGKFLAAWEPKASLDNEQTHVGLNCGGRKILVKQIAGLIARRIVCRAEEGQAVTRGDRFGLIKFGSRTDLFLPLDATVKVQVGDKVSGASTIIAELP